MDAKTRKLALTALFVAFILLLGFTPLGMIPLPWIKVSILSIPVSVGTIVLGLPAGLALGAAFGTVSALSAFGIVGAPSALAAALVSASPLLAILLCYVPRLLIPVFVYGTYRIATRKNAQSKRAISYAAAAGSLCNTVFYLGLMLLFYVILGINSESVLAAIGGTGLIAGGSEAIVAVLIVTPVTLAIQKIKK